MQNLKRAALYIRVSSEEQTEYSPDSQLKIIKKYAKENNIEILNEYIYQDDGISGRNADKRPAFQKMINDAKNIVPKPFDVVLIYAFSRFARNREDSIVYKSMLRKKLGIDVISVTQELSDKKESVIIEAMYEAMDEYYSLDLAENVKRGRDEKASRGEWNGKPPFGYDYDRKNKTLKINEDSEIIKLIFNDFILEPNIRKIANKLRAMNIRSKCGKIFDDRTVKYILKNVAYIGKITNRKDNILEGKHQAIIDDDTWNKVQNIITEREKSNFKYQKKEVKNESWLRGLLICSKCGHRLIICSYKNNAPYFQCGYYSKAQCKCSQYINVSKVEDAIMEKIKETFKNKLNINISNESNDEMFSSEQNILLNKMNTLIQKEKRIKLAYEDGIDTLEEYKENKKRILNEKEILKQQLDNFDIEKIKKKKIDHIYKKSAELYKILSDEKTSIDIKFNLAHLLIDKIIFDKKSNKLEIYYK